MKTREEVNDLKRQWLSDQCWDLELTEGFEDHSDELLAFREFTSAKVEQDHQEKIQRRAEQLHVSTAMASYIIRLEEKLDQLANRISDLEED